MVFCCLSTERRAVDVLVGFADVGVSVTPTDVSSVSFMLLWDGICSVLLLWKVALAVDLCVLGLEVEVEYKGEDDGNFVDAGSCLVFRLSNCK